MIKEHGKYILFLANTSQVHRESGDAHYHLLATYDWMYCWADNIYGPYSTAKPAVPHAGDTCAFKDKDGQWHNTLFGNGGTAPINCRFGILLIDIRWDGQEIIVEQKNP